MPSCTSPQAAFSASGHTAYRLPHHHFRSKTSPGFPNRNIGYLPAPLPTVSAQARKPRPLSEVSGTGPAPLPLPKNHLICRKLHLRTTRADPDAVVEEAHIPASVTEIYLGHSRLVANGYTGIGFRPLGCPVHSFFGNNSSKSPHGVLPAHAYGPDNIRTYCHFYDLKLCTKNHGKRIEIIAVPIPNRPARQQRKQLCHPVLIVDQTASRICCIEDLAHFHCIGNIQADKRHLILKPITLFEIFCRIRDPAHQKIRVLYLLRICKPPHQRFDSLNSVLILIRQKIFSSMYFPPNIKRSQATNGFDMQNIDMHPPNLSGSPTISDQLDTPSNLTNFIFILHHSIVQCKHNSTFPFGYLWQFYAVNCRNFTINL